MKEEISQCQDLLPFNKMVFRRLISNRNEVKMNKSIYLGLSILEISKTLMYKFDMIILNQNIKTMQNYVY